jgi:hypothetical protein
VCLREMRSSTLLGASTIPAEPCIIFTRGEQCDLRCGREVPCDHVCLLFLPVPKFGEGQPRPPVTRDQPDKRD